MNRLTEEFHELLRPEAALIAYRCEEPQRKYYLETRPILDNGKMGEGRPVSHEFITLTANRIRAYLSVLCRSACSTATSAWAGKNMSGSIRPAKG